MIKWWLKIGVNGEPITFITSDVRLQTAALAEGFSIDDPNAHS